MARFFRKLANYLRPRTAGYGGTILSFSALTSFKEKDLKPVDKSLKLENYSKLVCASKAPKVKISDCNWYR